MIQTENIDFGILDGEQREIFFIDGNGKKQSLGLAYVDTTDEGFSVALVGVDSESNTSVIGVQSGGVTLKTISANKEVVTVINLLKNSIQITSNDLEFKGITYHSASNFLFQSNSLVPKSYIDEQIEALRIELQ